MTPSRVMKLLPLITIILLTLNGCSSELSSPDEIRSALQSWMNLNHPEAKLSITRAVMENDNPVMDMPLESVLSQKTLNKLR